MIKVSIVFLSIILANAAMAQDVSGFTPPGPNVALGKSYTLEQDPNYWLTQDEGDLVQLTDGEFAPEEGGVHFHKHTVGWYYGGRPILITVDLEESTPIAGVALSTGAGGGGVHWPSAILVAVSPDGEDFQVVGELTHLSAIHRQRPQAGRHIYATDALRCYGRYVRFIISTPGTYTFSDEIMIYRGADELLGQDFTGEVIGDIGEYLSANRVPLAIRTWVAGDLMQARLEMAESGAPQEVQAQAAAIFDGVETANSALLPAPGPDFRAIFPLTDAHEQVFQALGSLRGAAGMSPLQPWKNNRWQRLSLWDLPPADQPAGEVAMQVRMIQREHRADTVNIANNSSTAVTARVRLEGLPGGATPGYASLRQVKYVAMTAGFWDANALPQAPLADGAWHIDLPAGISRQLWLALNPGADVEPGTYEGALVVEPDGGEAFSIPLSFVLEPLQYPDEHTLSFGMWDYAYGRGSYGLTPENIPAALEHMQSYGYNVPWSHIFAWVPEEGFNEQDELLQQPDMTRFDEWVAKWPDAHYYASYMYVGTSYAGAQMGTEKFNRRVGATMRAWADHVRALDIDLSRIMLLLVDEPHGGEADERSLAWAQAIRAAVPEFTLFVDPCHYEPHKTGLREMFEIHDILCPHLGRYESGGQEVWDFYEELRAGGRELWTYIASGGPATLDAIRSFRAQQWKLWEMKGTGTGFWAYGPGGRDFTSWNTLAADTELYSPAYIGVDSVDDGKHWLAIIEGIQDYEYLRMLRDRIAELEAAGRQDQALEDARKLLQTLPAEAIEAAEDGDLDAYDAARLRVLDVLVAL